MATSGRSKGESAPGIPQLLQGVVADALNVLVVVQAYAERLDERHDDPAFRDEMRSFIAQAFTRVDGALDRLELASAARSARPVAIDLSQQIAGVLDRHWSEWMGRNVLLANEIDPGLPLIWADPEHLTEALGSLVSVVLALGADGKDVSLRSESVPAEIGGIGVVRLRLEAWLGSKIESISELPEVRLAGILIRAQAGSLETRVDSGSKLLVCLELPTLPVT